MKVLFLSNEQFLPLSGGGSVGNYNLVKKLAERGHEVTVATPLYLGSEQARRVQIENNITLKPFSPFYIHKNVSFRGPKYLLYSALFLLHLIRLFIRERYDVLLVRNCLLALPALLCKPFVKARYVVSMTDFLTGFLHNNDSYPAKAVQLMYNVERALPRFFDLAFVITPQMKRLLLSGGAKPSRVHVAYDGVDTSLFNPSTLDVDEVEDIRWKYGLGRRIVLFHGTIDDHAQKKLSDIISAVRERDSGVVFILIGQGKRYDALRAQYESEGVRFPGYVPHEDIPKYACAADVGIIPYENNFNSDIIITLKLLEYLAVGLQVVSTDLKSIRELFGSYDFISLAADTDEFADEVLKRISYGKSENAIALIREVYSWDKITSTMVSQIEETTR